MNQLIGSLALLPIEQFVNRLLNSDPHVRQKLTDFAGKTLQVITRSPAFTATVLFEDDQIRLNAVDAETMAIDADATISGRSNDLLALLVRNSDDRSLADSGIELSGDASLVHDLYSTLRAMDIDWEDYLAPFLGDVITNEVGKLAQEGRQWSDSVRGNLNRNVEDYIKEEARLVPRREQVSKFGDELDRLKLRIDRVKAKADLLYARLDGLGE